MYHLTLVVHSYLRWAVLALLAVVLLRAAVGWARASAWTRPDEGLHVALMRTIDVQFLVGIALYVLLSPFSRAFFADPGQGMKEPAIRFFGVEHLTGMLAAVAAVHIGRGRSRKAATPRLRHRRVCISSLIALALVLLSIPWPSRRYGRPLLRALGAGGAASTLCPPSFAARCTPCHGPRGAGDGFASSSLRPPPRNFTEPGWLSGRTDAQLAAVIRDGGAAHGLSPAMPSHRGLGEAEIEALVGCVRKLGSSP